MNEIAKQAGAGEDLLQLVSFRIGQEEFGIDILKVQEINRMTDVTRVPNAPQGVEGVINLRGKVMPVINLRTRLGMSPKERDKNTRIVVVEVEGTVVGFVVDAVNKVLRIPKGITEPPPSIASGSESEFITGVGKLDDRLLLLLDLNRLVSTGDLSAVN
jgi:purine-binding chemotaxis protein CheW